MPQPPLGVYGQAYLETLKEHRPEEYARAEQAGTLAKDAKAAQARAEAKEQEAFAALRAKHPSPKDYASRVQHLMTLESQAKELAMDEAIVPPEEQAPPELRAQQRASSGRPPALRRRPTTN